MLVTVRNYPQGRRVWIVGQRVHHGATGLGLVAAGIALMVHDRRDWRAWLARERPLPPHGGTAQVTPFGSAGG